MCTRDSGEIRESDDGGNDKLRVLQFVPEQSDADQRARHAEQPGEQKQCPLPDPAVSVFRIDLVQSVQDGGHDRQDRFRDQENPKQHMPPYSLTAGARMSIQFVFISVLRRHFSEFFAMKQNRHYYGSNCQCEADTQNDQYCQRAGRRAAVL